MVSVQPKKLDFEKEEEEEKGEKEEKMPLIGNIEAFVLGDEFKLYKERLNHFMRLNKINDDKEKIDILASFGEADLFKVIHSLIQPKTVNDFTYVELVVKLEAHFAPKRNIVAESFKFNKRDQKQGESISEFIIEFKSMAQLCEFGEFLDRALRDRFICGINNESIQRVLFNDGDLKTFEMACSKALTMETTKTDMEIIRITSLNKGHFKVTHEEIPTTKIK